MPLIRTSTGYATVTKPASMVWIHCPTCNKKLGRASAGSRVEVFCTRCKNTVAARVDGGGVQYLDTNSESV